MAVPPMVDIRRVSLVGRRRARLWTTPVLSDDQIVIVDTARDLIPFASAVDFPDDCLVVCMNARTRGQHGPETDEAVAVMLIDARVALDPSLRTRWSW